MIISGRRERVRRIMGSRPASWERGASRGGASASGPGCDLIMLLTSKMSYQSDAIAAKRPEAQRRGSGSIKYCLDQKIVKQCQQPGSWAVLVLGGGRFF